MVARGMFLVMSIARVGARRVGFFAADLFKCGVDLIGFVFFGREQVEHLVADYDVLIERYGPVFFDDDDCVAAYLG